MQQNKLSSCYKDMAVLNKHSNTQIIVEIVYIE